MGDGLNPFPGYPHIGPGNTILQESTNKLDNIARAHDIRYAIAIRNTQIAEADQIFINEIENYSPETLYEWCIKYISYIGILTKFKLERIIGPIYPRLPYHLQQELYTFIFNEITRRKKYSDNHQYQLLYTLNKIAE